VKVFDDFCQEQQPQDSDSDVEIENREIRNECNNYVLATSYIANGYVRRRGSDAIRTELVEYF
jgi:hypothetical protein